MMSLRTLGHFPHVNFKLMKWEDWVSVFISALFVVLFTVELLIMFYMDEFLYQRLKYCHEHGKEFNWRTQALYRMYYDLTTDDVAKTGVIVLKSQFKNLPRIKDRFARSYNSLTILRLYAMVVLYISCQMWPLLQIVSMMTITGTFLFMTVRKQSRIRMFHSKVTYVFRLLEEITIMLALFAVLVYY
jgi:hypothetical protein